MAKTLRLEVPGSLKFSTNKAWSCPHWGIRSGMRNRWHSLITEAVSKSKFVVPNPADFSYVFSFPANALDSTNCSVMVKMVEDSLVEAGCMEDDTSELVRQVSMRSVKDKTLKRPASYRGKRKVKDPFTVLISVSPTKFK